MSGHDSEQRLLYESLERALGPLCALPEDPGEWPAAAWQTVEAHGMLDVLAEEPQAWPLAVTIAAALGEYPVPLPIVETLLVRAFDPDAARGAPATLEAADGALPWGRFCRTALIGREGSCARTTLEDVQHTGANLAGEPRDQCRIGAAEPLAVPVQRLASGLALLRAAQCAGAMRACLNLSRQYVLERVQFGRPLSRFQAIQQQMAQLAGACAAADVGVQYAGRRTRQAGLDEAAEAIACAATRVLSAAAEVSAIAHQVHGAMGFTLEYPLHRYTQRLGAWSAELNLGGWAERLGGRALARGGGDFWDGIVKI
ncbi:MAG: hypothetical protein ISN29_10525 [Gammaproteobacteria bacterium AqS3]|nr:hypothetical protein [Gammaproteobacteria bacterium AqS3]